VYQVSFSTQGVLKKRPLRMVL